MSERTPTPWFHTRSGIEDASYSHISTGPDNYGDIATVWGMDNLGVNNAAFIVKAVNSHEALVKALEAIAGWRTVNLSAEYEYGLRGVINSVVDCAADALASIKETAK